MSTSHRVKERHKKSSLNNDGDGTSARTRPVSFEEIMLRRKKKSSSEDLKGGAVEPEKRDVDVEKNVSHKKDSSSTDEKRRVAEKERNTSSARREKIGYTDDKPKENHLKRKDSEIPTIGRKLKSVVSRPSDDVSDGIKGGKSDRQARDKREYDKHWDNRARDESGKRYSRDSRGKESHGERESKRKYRDEDRIAAKKLDTGKHYETKVSERNKRRETLKPLVEAPKTRRRSRSRDRDDRQRRSRSPSTRAHKRSSRKNEVSPHALEDRSQKQNHTDKNKLPSNGLSGHYRRYDETRSGLGGYSPRKRISEAAAKTPPPPDPSLSEKKSAKWDIPPPGINKTLPALVLSNFQSSNSIESTVVQELATTTSLAISTPAKLPYNVFAAPSSTKIFSSVDSIQLTQATRPMRRLYVDNVPSLTSEKDLVKWLNDLFLLSGVNHVPGTQPCINCIINKDKAQAVVEFLTPEDASTALSFDGSSFSGSVLKIRRPKDFVEVATGNVDKSAAVVDTIISDVVKDSPSKIFIGGISKALSSKMLMEIVSTFGPLKAYHFEINGDLNEQCAFLEYVDQSVTLKACAGLNGLKLGGKVLTVVQAIHGAETLAESSALYEIPQHAKPLLKQPTQVLRLKNVFNIEDLSALSELEVEVLEDIRLECSRFGNVKSVNVIKQRDSPNTGIETREFNGDAQTEDFEQNSGTENISAKKTKNLEGHMNDDSNGIESVKFPSNVKELQDDEAEKDTGAVDKSPWPSQLQVDVPFEVTGSENDPSVVLEELPNQPNSPKQEKKSNPEENKTRGNQNSSESEIVDKLNLNTKTECGITEKQGFDLENIFEFGCVFVEFGRIEAACTAAHCLHGRVFDSRTVSVEYVALDRYKSRFPK